MEKYLPIHIQGQITETLAAILGGRERRRLELYDSEKNAILYAHLLKDDDAEYARRVKGRIEKTILGEVKIENLMILKFFTYLSKLLFIFLGNRILRRSLPSG